MIRTCIVGCGEIATQKYLPILGKMGDVATVGAICDLDEKQLEGAAQRFGISKTYTQFDKMIAEEQPDVVVICTPPGTHKFLTVAALSAGANVLVEKPMALTSEDCDEMIDAARQHGKKLGVMHNQLFNPAFMEAGDILSRGEIGKFIGMRILGLFIKGRLL